MNGKSVIHNKQKNLIEIRFPFSWDDIELVRQITGSDFDKARRVWTIPATPWHLERATELLEPAGFEFESMRVGEKKSAPSHSKYPKDLFPFQRVGVDFVFNAGGRAIIADDMGLGKTVEALTVARIGCYRTLVVAPAVVLFKWAKEAERWAPNHTVDVIQTGKQKIGNETLLIMSYGIMVSRYEELAAMNFDLIIFDEAHYVKGAKTQRTRVARALVRSGIPRVLFLSGTPFINHPSELFQILNMLDPVGYSSYFSFARRYCGAVYEMGHWFFPPGAVSNLGELSERLQSVMIRRTKQEVLKDLPELTRTLIPIEIENRNEYNMAVHDFAVWLHEDGKTVKDPTHVLTRLNVLRQVVGRGKVDAAVELAESILAADRKVVLFAHHREVVTMLYNALKEYGVLQITGETSNRERYQNSNLFLMSDSRFRVIIISVAGAEGIDLFSSADIIFVEREWTPAKEEQAESRLHRQGQKAAVTSWYLVGRKTIDEKFVKVIQEKREVIGQVVRQDDIVQEILKDFQANEQMPAINSK